MVKKIVLFLLLLLIVGVVAYILFPKSEKEKIRAVFDSLSYSISKGEGKGVAGLVLKSQALSSLFDETCTVSIGNSNLSGVYSPEEIASNAFILSKLFSSVQLKFHDLNIAITNPEEAIVNVTARLSCSKKSGGKITETREFDALLVKKNKKWLLSELKVVQVLKK